MPSGCFVLDNHITIKEYDQFIDPFVSEAGGVVSNKIYIPDRFSSPSESGLLLALSTKEEGSDEVLSRSLVNAGNPLKELENKGDHSSGFLSMYIRTEDHYETESGEVISGYDPKDSQERIPVYRGVFTTKFVSSADNAASLMFPMIAQGMYLKYIENQTEKVEQKMSQFLNQRIKDL